MGKKSFGERCVRKYGSGLRRLQKWVSFQQDAYRFSFHTSDVKARVKRIGGGYRGSDAEWRKVEQYWQRFGIKPKRDWYALYCDGSDAYDPRYIPDPIWFRDIVPYFNNTSMSPAYADKAIYNRLLPDVKKPETIVKRTAGHYFNGDGEQPISHEEAVRICEGEEHLIIKPSGGTKGAGILFYDRDEENSLRIPAIFDAMSSGFVVQRIVKQHPDLARLNPESLNTVRVISFHFKGAVHILSAQLRIGGVGSRVDNYSAGGNAVAVKPNGWLYEKSVNHDMEWVEVAPNGIKLKEVKVPNYQRIVDTIKRLHCNLPYFNIIGWDFAVDEDGTPIMIEYNTKPGQNQIGGREPTFGDLTDEVLEDVFIKKTLKNAFKR
jgi:hypothetical protein